MIEIKRNKKEVKRKVLNAMVTTDDYRDFNGMVSGGSYDGIGDMLVFWKNVVLKLIQLKNDGWCFYCHKGKVDWMSSDLGDEMEVLEIEL